MTDSSSVTQIFFKTVRQHSGPAPKYVGPGTSLRDIVGMMATDKLSAVICVDESSRPVGILTEQDIVRRVAFNADSTQPASDIMTSPVLTVDENERLYVALARMRRHGHRHLPVVDSDGRLSGLLDLHDVTAFAAGDLIERIDDLTHGRSIDGLTETKAAQVDLARELIADGISGPEVQTLITHINNDIYQQVTWANAAGLEAEGRGGPPVDYCLIIMGSGGRGENYLSPDQDYGFILADFADDRFESVDPWFVELAARVSKDLDRIGIRFCSGDVMATNPLWRKTISGWKTQIDRWNERSDEQDLLNFDIFFDFRAMSDNPELAAELRRHVTTVMRHNMPFVRRLYSADRDLGTALRWFGRFATETKDGPDRGKINVKLHGSVPLVQSIRLLSLREGVTPVNTIERMTELFELGVLKPDEHDYLVTAYTTICDLLLNRQIDDYRAGRAISNHIHPRHLNRRQKARLREAFSAINDLRGRINFEIGGEVY